MNSKPINFTHQQSAYLIKLGLLTLILSHGLPASASTKQWLGTMKCGALQNSPNSKSPEPFSGSITLTISKNTANLDRTWKKGKESLTGPYTSGLPLQLSGLGWRIGSESKPWRTSATLIENGRKFEGSAKIESPDGKTHYRDCTINATEVSEASKIAITNNNTPPKIPQSKDHEIADNEHERLLRSREKELAEKLQEENEKKIQAEREASQQRPRASQSPATAVPQTPKTNVTTAPRGSVNTVSPKKNDSSQSATTTVPQQSNNTSAPETRNESTPKEGPPKINRPSVRSATDI